MEEKSTFVEDVGVQIEWRDVTAKSVKVVKAESSSSIELKRYGFLLGKSRKAGLHISVSAAANQRITLYVDGKKSKAWTGSRSGHGRSKGLHNSLAEYPGARRLDFTFEHYARGRWTSSDRVRIGRGKLAGSVTYTLGYDDGLSNDRDFNDAKVVASLPPF